MLVLSFPVKTQGHVTCINVDVHLKRCISLWNVTIEAWVERPLNNILGKENTMAELG